MKKNASSAYLTTQSAVSGRGFGRGVKLLCSTIIAVILGTMFLGTAVAAQQTKKAEAIDWVQWIMCSVAPDPSKDLYQYSQSSDLWYQLRSKSTMNGGVSDVETGLNWVLNLFGPGFKETNLSILGYDLDGIEPEDIDRTVKPEEKFNKGAKVNVFDRFGVAGMSFNSYQGEWKYILVDACNPETEPKDPRAGLYYENRLEPRSTWEYVSTSSDPRTIQFDRGIIVQYWTSIVNVIANAIFWVTKVIVVITIALISLSLADLTTMFGLNDFIGSEGGLFDTLFAGIFMPLVFLAFLATAFKLFWDGIVKRQYRASLITVLRSLFMFFMAIVISMNPAFWMSVPNNIAIIGQSIVLTTMSGNLPSNGGLCNTDVGKYKITDGKQVNTVKESVELLSQASENMRSSVSCQFWQAFLFRPWVEGQFGTDWRTLWANDQIPEWSEKEKSADLGNLNAETVGDAAVPLGDGEFINNWAVYQLSAQTNVHAVTEEGKIGEPSKYTSGVSNDWWKIVDALSNYDEEKKSIDLVVSSGTPGVGTVTTSGEYVFPIANAQRTSSFGYRVHPVTGENKLHAGNDYGAPTGTPLYAVADGTVELVSSSTGGNKVHLKGVDGWEYRYLHLSAYSVKNGDTVKAGQEVGKVGSTGRVTGAHLHFETRDPSGTEIDTNTRLTEMGFNPENGSGEGTGQSVGSGAGGTSSMQPYEYGVPKNNPVTPYWDTWVGNNSFGRIFASLSSIVIALVGLSAPLVLSGMAAIYSVSTAIMMAFAPLFLLAGCWSGRGWDLFKGWAELVINTTLKRIIIGLLLAISMSFVVTAIGIIEDVGWFQGVIVMALLSVLLLNSREKIVNMMANVRFAGSDLSGTAGRLGGIVKKQTLGRAQTLGKDTARAGGSVAAGAIGSKRAGGTFKEGAKYGLKREMKNLTYRKKSLQDARITYEETKASQDGTTEEKILNGQEQCAACRKVIEYDEEQNGTGIFRGGRTPEGNLLCYDCYVDGVRPDADEVEYVYSGKMEEQQNKKEKEATDKLNKKIMTAQSSFISPDKAGKTLAQRLVNELEKDEHVNFKDKTTEKIKTSDLRRSKLVQLANFYKYDVNNYEKALSAYEADNTAPIPASAEVPEFLKPYIENEELIAAAWMNKDYEFIGSAYAAAIYIWYRETVGDKADIDWNEFYLMTRNEEWRTEDKITAKQAAEDKKRKEAEEKKRQES